MCVPGWPQRAHGQSGGRADLVPWLPSQRPTWPGGRRPIRCPVTKEASVCFQPGVDGRPTSVLPTPELECRQVVPCVLCDPSRSWAARPRKAIANGSDLQHQSTRPLVDIVNVDDARGSAVVYHYHRGAVS